MNASLKRTFVGAAFAAAGAAPSLGWIGPSYHEIVPRLTLQDGTVLTCSFTASSQLADGSILRWGVFGNTSVGCHLHINGTNYEITISNGAIDALDWTSFRGGVFYSGLTVESDAPIAPFLLRNNETCRANTYTIVRSGSHYLPARSLFSRRFGVGASYSLGAEKQFPIASYGATRTPLYGPKIAHDTVGLRGLIAKGISAGNFDWQANAMGPFFPHYGPQADDVGGTGIEFNPGWDGDATFHAILADSNEERMPLAAFDRATGKTLNFVDFGRKPFSYRLTRGFSRVVQYPHFAAIDDKWVGSSHVITFKDYNTGTCAYKDTLTRYMPMDCDHLIRGYGDDYAAAYLANDWLSKWRIGVYAADAQVSWSFFQEGPLVPQYPGQWINFSLAEEDVHYFQFPNTGGVYGRNVGWLLHCITASSDLGNDVRINKMWLARMYSLLGRVVMPTGLCSNNYYPYGSNGVPWDVYGMPHNYSESDYFQIPILCNGVFATQQYLHADPAIARKIIALSADQVFALPQVASIYGGNAVGPPWYLVVGKDGVPVTTLSEGFGLSHWMHIYEHLALAYRITGDKKYLDKMLVEGIPSASKQELLSRFQADSDRNFWTEAIGVIK